MIVAIDGPVGAGKSTVARGVAQALSYSYLDSGALYRCVALASLEDPSRSPQEHAATLDVSLGERVLLEGRDVTREIRSPTVSAEASLIAALPEVRATLLTTQRALLGSGDWVAEGRDIGTVVAPSAEVKVYLTASEDERARRRARELGAEVEEVRRELAARDARDGGRDLSPLVAAPNAFVLDSGGLAVDQVVAQIVNLVKEAARS
jgi:cytidylate kinase